MATQLVLLPGMGADERLLAPQRNAFPELVVPKWIAPEPLESLRDYAGRLARGIPPAEDRWIGGVSFGGMIALEMAPLLRPRGVLLISSTADPRNVRALMRAAAALAPVVPDRLLRSRLLARSVARRAFAPINTEDLRLVAEQGLATPNRFLRWAAFAFRNWTGARTPSIRVISIHGDRDRVIPATRVSPDFLVRGGGHALNLTHAAEVNSIIRKMITEAGHEPIGVSAKERF
jgi:pimeloyl-ACP methyl ester carboxylesterase